MVGQKNRLGSLHMGVARQYGVKMLVGQINYYPLQPAKSVNYARCFIAQKHPCIHGYLIIAASGGMKFLCNRSRNFDQTGLYVHVDVFQAVVKVKTIFIDFLSDFFKPLNHGPGFFISDNRDFGQHFTMRNTAGNIIGVQPPVHLDRRRKRLNNMSCFF